MARTGASIAVAAFAAVLALSAAEAGAQAYPSKPITLVVGFGPGGVGDLTARVVSAKVSAAIGQQILISNKPSAGGIVAADAVAKAQPDGYTLFLMTNGNAVSESLYRNLPFDIKKDFAPVTTLGFFDLAVAVKGDAGYSSIKDLLAWLRANPGEANIGTINVGSTQNLAANLLLSLGGLDQVIVPYKSSPDVLVALRGGDVQLAVDMLAPLVNQAKSGAVKILATTGERRYAGTPDIPTVAESGISGYSASSWNAIAAPANTPKAIIDLLNREYNAALASPDVRDKLLELGVVAKGGSPEDMRLLLSSEIDKWSAVIDKAGIQKQ